MSSRARPEPARRTPPAGVRSIREAAAVAAKLSPRLSCSDLGRSLAFDKDPLGRVETCCFPDHCEPAYFGLMIGVFGDRPGWHRLRAGARSPAASPTGHRVELRVCASLTWTQPSRTFESRLTRSPVGDPSAGRSISGGQLTSGRISSYSASPCSQPGIGSSHSCTLVPTSTRPTF